jgi:hypothetical protein
MSSEQSVAQAEISFKCKWCSKKDSPSQFHTPKMCYDCHFERVRLYKQRASERKIAAVKMAKTNPELKRICKHCQKEGSPVDFRTSKMCNDCAVVKQRVYNARAYAKQPPRLLKRGRPKKIISPQTEIVEGVVKDMRSNFVEFLKSKYIKDKRTAYNTSEVDKLNDVMKNFEGTKIQSMQRHWEIAELKRLEDEKID